MKYKITIRFELESDSISKVEALALEKINNKDYKLNITRMNDTLTK